jgi:hypothetical protein
LTAVGTTSGSHAARLQPGFQLGEYRLGQPLWPMRIADAYKAEGPHGPATVYVVHAKLAAVPEVRDQIIAGTRAAAALPEHKHLVRTLAAGLTGDILWIATEEVAGSSVKDMLSKKRLAGQNGLGTRAAGNLITGVASALGEAHHGALSNESVVVDRTGRVRVIDLALGLGTVAAMVMGLIEKQSNIAPELFHGGTVDGPVDVYGVGALLYEVLVGSPLERGGPRPSDVVKGVNTQIDEVVARACHRDAEKRFGRADVLGEVVNEALTKGGAVNTQSVPLVEKQPALMPEGPSLAASLTNMPAAASGANVDRALATALADSTEKWLIAKGRLDYGPFSLQAVVDQIESGTIVAGNIIMDKDTGNRVDVAEHPLLGPMVDAAKQKRDDARRNAAEVQVAKSQTKKGAVLYAAIGLGVAGAVVGVYLIIQAASSSEKEKIGGVGKIEGAQLKVTVTLPKKPPPSAHHSSGTGGTHRTGNGGNDFTKGNEDLSLDMSDDGDEGSETLDMGTVYKVYSGYGGQLGGCLQSSGEHSANIYINIDGPSGKVKFVKINGKQSGGLYGCMNGVLRRMKFPSIHGPRTRAEFDISL